MKVKKVLAAGLASITLLSASATTVSAHSKGTLVQLMSDIPAYNAKGKKIKKARPFYQGDVYEILGVKKIKGKKFYRLTKKKYVIANDSKIVNSKNVPSEKPVKQKWESKHLVDTLPGLTDQIKKAFTLDGEDKLEAYQEIAQQLGMDPNSITSSTQKGFEDRLKSYVGSMDDAKNWIESGGK